MAILPLIIAIIRYKKKNVEKIELIITWTKIFIYFQIKESEPFHRDHLCYDLQYNK